MFRTILLLASIDAEVLQRVRSMVEVLSHVEDDRFAVTRLARLGPAVCRYDGETAAFVYRMGAARQSQAHLGGRPALAVDGCGGFATAARVGVFCARPSCEGVERIRCSHGRKAAGDIRASAFGFVERAGGRQFPLDVPGVTGYAFADIAPVFASDLDRLEATVAGFENQERRLDAEIDVLALRLRRPRRGD